MVMTMKTPQNKYNLDANIKPLPSYKNMDNSMNSLTLRARERINTNINPPQFITDILPSISEEPSITPAITTQNFMYGMLSNIQKNRNCSSCGGSK